MKKFRILEKTDISGDICFFPQYQKFFIWFNFYEMEVFPKVIRFYSLNTAKDFIEKQKQSPSVKIHYI